MRRSTSQRRTYRSCAMSYYHRYVSGWKERRWRGPFAFGTRMQDVADAIIQRRVTTGDEAKALFRELWAPYEKDEKILWSPRKPWVFFNARGEKLAAYMATELPKVIQFHPGSLYNERLMYDLGGTPELVIPDFYGPVLEWDPQGGLLVGTGGWKGIAVPTVLDFKTSDREYQETAAEIDEQLTDGQLAVEASGKPVKQVGLCVLIYKETPQIQWLMAPARGRDEQDAFVASAQIEAKRIAAGEFPRNERACYAKGECAFIPLCYPSQRARIEEELVRPEAPAWGQDDPDWGAEGDE